MAEINRFGGLNEYVAVVDNQFCSFELKLSCEMFSHLITCRVVEVSISPPIRWSVSVRYYKKHGDSVSQWTRLAVERMLTCGTCAMGIRRYCCALPDCNPSCFFCQSCKSKTCSACGMKDGIQAAPVSTKELEST